MSTDLIKSIANINGNDKMKAPKTGDIVKVHYKIEERGKERIQIFQGLVISVKKPHSPECSITVRKDENHSGIERIFPLYSPAVKKFEVISRIHSRRSKLYFVRKSNKKLKEIKK